MSVADAEFYNIVSLDVSVPLRMVSQLTARMGGTSTCWMPFFACSCALIFAAAAAAAAAALLGVDGLLSDLGLRDAFARGLRLLRESVFLSAGDRDLRSNLEGLRGSGSV